MENKVVLEVLDPRGEVAGGGRVASSPRLNTLMEKTIGLVWNGKPHADVLLNYVEDLLHERHPSLRTRRYTTSNVANKLKEGELEGIAREVDAVVYASGD